MVLPRKLLENYEAVEMRGNNPSKFATPSHFCALVLV
jgi:hypothetical protein